MPRILCEIIQTQIEFARDAWRRAAWPALIELGTRTARVRGQGQPAGAAGPCVPASCAGGRGQGQPGAGAGPCGQLAALRARAGHGGAARAQRQAQAGRPGALAAARAG